MHKSRPGVFVIDCDADDLEDANAFWSAALGYAVADSDEKYSKLETPEGQPQILLQAVDHPSRIHLDIETDDKEAEVARLEKLGAKRVGDVKRWVVMEAPTGHRFCIVNPQRPDFADGSKEWPSE